MLLLKLITNTSVSLEKDASIQQEFAVRRKLSEAAAENRD